MVGDNLLWNENGWCMNDRKQCKMKTQNLSKAQTDSIINSMFKMYVGCSFEYLNINYIIKHTCLHYIITYNL